VQCGAKVHFHRGLNIQRPWAGLILQGRKTIEARTYPLRGYKDESIWIIQTPGKLSPTDADAFEALGRADRVHGVLGLSDAANGQTRPRRRRSGPPPPKPTAHIVGILRFTGCVQYSDYEHWRSDEPRHMVPEGSSFDWQPEKGPMFGWQVGFTRALLQPAPGPSQKGMIGCKVAPRMALFPT
jgi:hypothetical protein